MAEALRVPYQTKLAHVYAATIGIAADCFADGLPAESESGDGESDQSIKNGIA